MAWKRISFDQMVWIAGVRACPAESYPVGAAVAVGHDRRGQVDPVHDHPAQYVAHRIGVVGQDELHHLNPRLAGALSPRPS